MQAVQQRQASWWPATDSTADPDARQAIVWALLGLIIPVVPSLVAVHVSRRAAIKIDETPGRTGLPACRVAMGIAVFGLIWGVAAVVAVLAHI